MLVLGQVLAGRYRIGPLLGRGGMADVHRGEDLVTAEAVAIKVLRTGLVDGRWSDREVDALSRVDHPAVVRLRASGVDDGVPYLVLDLVDGEPLSTTLASGPLTPSRATALVAEVAEGLDRVHSAGVVHRDIKPSNILLDRVGRPHLADFGVARLMDATATTGAGFVIGTAAYLAPEQVRGDYAGPAADVYALGLVLLECLTGERAYPGTFNEAAAAHLVRDPAVPAGVPIGLVDAIGAATARDPFTRPSARELAATLRRVADDDVALDTMPIGSGPRTAVMPVAMAPSRPRRPRKGRVALIGAVAIGAAAGISGGLAFAAHSDGGTPAPTTTVPAATTATPTTVIPTTVVVTTTVPPSAPTTVRAAAAATTAKPTGKDHDKQNGD